MFRFNFTFIILFLNLVSFLFSLSLSAAKSDPANLDKVMKNYKQADTVILDVRKTVKSEILDKETVYKGVIRFSKGKLHWTNEEPSKSLIIYDGSILWSIQYPPAEFKSPPQVAKTKLKKGKSSPLVLTSLLGDKPLKKYFEVAPDNIDGIYQTFKLKEIKNTLGVKDILLTIDTKLDRLVKLQYIDEVENLTKLEFRGTQFNEVIKPTMFSFKPPKGITVQEY